MVCYDPHLIHEDWHLFVSCTSENAVDGIQDSRSTKKKSFVLALCTVWCTNGMPVYKFDQTASTYACQTKMNSSSGAAKSVFSSETIKSKINFWSNSADMYARLAAENTNGERARWERSLEFAEAEQQRLREQKRLRGS